MSMIFPEWLHHIIFDPKDPFPGFGDYGRVFLPTIQYTAPSFAYFKAMRDRNGKKKEGKCESKARSSRNSGSNDNHHSLLVDTKELSNLTKIENPEDNHCSTTLPLDIPPLAFTSQISMNLLYVLNGFAVDQLWCSLVNGFAIVFGLIWTIWFPYVTFKSPLGRREEEKAMKTRTGEKKTSKDNKNIVSKVNPKTNVIELYEKTKDVFENDEDDQRLFHTTQGEFMVPDDEDDDEVERLRERYLSKDSNRESSKKDSKDIISSNSKTSDDPNNQHLQRDNLFHKFMGLISVDYVYLPPENGNYQRGSIAASSWIFRWQYYRQIMILFLPLVILFVPWFTYERVAYFEGSVYGMPSSWKFDLEKKEYVYVGQGGKDLTNGAMTMKKTESDKKTKEGSKTSDDKKQSFIQMNTNDNESQKTDNKESENGSDKSKPETTDDKQPKTDTDTNPKPNSDSPNPSQHPPLPKHSDALLWLLPLGYLSYGILFSINPALGMKAAIRENSAEKMGSVMMNLLNAIVCGLWMRHQLWYGWQGQEMQIGSILGGVQNLIGFLMNLSAILVRGYIEDWKGIVMGNKKKGKNGL